MSSATTDYLRAQDSSGGRSNRRACKRNLFASDIAQLSEVSNGGRSADAARGYARPVRQPDACSGPYAVRMRRSWVTYTRGKYQLGCLTWFPLASWPSLLFVRPSLSAKLCVQTAKHEARSLDHQDDSGPRIPSYLPHAQRHELASAGAPHGDASVQLSPVGTRAASGHGAGSPDAGTPPRAVSGR